MAADDLPDFGDQPAVSWSALLDAFLATGAEAAELEPSDFPGHDPSTAAIRLRMSGSRKGRHVVVRLRRNVVYLVREEAAG